MNSKKLLLSLLLLVPLYIFAEGGKSQIPLADPYILLEGDTYYAYGTNDANGIRCYTSDDLRVWKYEGLALNKTNTTEKQWFWAPEVYRIGNKYIMYYSANEHLYAATASSPKGPFKQVGSYQMEKLIGNEKCIDSHVFIDEDSTAYIFFVRFTDGNCIWQAKLSDDFITPVEGTLRKCFAASQSWELKMGRINEGPNIIKQGRRYYLTYSGNHYESQDYAVGYAYTTNIATGTWTKYTNNPILRRWDDLVGTGHHSLFYDKEGALRIVFHTHNSTESIHSRLMYIGTMQFRSNNLVMLNDPVIRPTLSTTAPYNPELITKSWGFKNGGAVTADLNNDGYQDIVAGGSTSVQNSATGETTQKNISYLALFSPTTHKWTKTSKTPPFYELTESPSLVPCDINNDGWMDIIAFDQSNIETDDITEGIFLGNGNGTFTAAEFSILNSNGTHASNFNIKAACNAEIIDVDNDGRLDIILAGHQGEENYNVILHNQSDNATSLSFNIEPYDTEYLLREAIIQPADLNNDGLQDFVISAVVDGKEDQVRFTDVFMNNPDQCGHFIRLGLGEKGADIKRKSNGTLQVADFNNDGWLDILLAGQGEASSGEATARQRIYANKKTEIEKYQSNIATQQAAIEEYEEDLRFQNELISQLEAEVLAAKKEILLENGISVSYSGEKMTWPCPAYTRISSEYGWRIHPTLGVNKYHNGVDMAAPTGSDILAAFSGEVVAATYNSTMGNYVLMNHGNGYYTIYMHASKLCVTPGEVIVEGEKIAEVGSTGRSTGPHLHFGVRKNGEYVNPMSYLNR